jgi:hypothetical protein
LERAQLHRESPVHEDQLVEPLGTKGEPVEKLPPDSRRLRFRHTERRFGDRSDWGEAPFLLAGARKSQLAEAIDGGCTSRAQPVEKLRFGLLLEGRELASITLDVFSDLDH